MLGHRQFPTTVAGYRALLVWMSEHGPLRSIWIEGTGSYGVGLARDLGSRAGFEPATHGGSTNALLEPVARCASTFRTLG